MLLSTMLLLLITLYCLSTGDADQLRMEKNPWSNKVNSKSLTCAINEIQKGNCGWAGVTQSQCEANGCCWSAGSGIPCYYPGQGTASPSLSPSHKPTANPTAPIPTATPTVPIPTAKPTTAVPTVKPTTAVPTRKPTTAAPSVSFAPTYSFAPTEAPTESPTEIAAVSSNSEDNVRSPVNIGVVVGALVGGIILFAGAFLLYVFCRLYDTKPEALPKEPPKTEPKGIQLTPYKGSESIANTFRDDASMYSLFSRANQSQITEYEVNRKDLEALENGTQNEDDESSIEFEGVIPGGHIRWYEGRDHGFVTP